MDNMDDKLKQAIDDWFSKQYYYHGFLPREDAVFLLYRTGDYVLRIAQTLDKSENGTVLRNYYVMMSIFAAPRGTPSTLPVDQRKPFVHHLIIDTTKSGFSLCKDETFESMEQLIQFYFRNPIDLQAVTEFDEKGGFDIKSQVSNQNSNANRTQESPVKKVTKVTLARGIALSNWEINHRQLEVGEQIRMEVGLPVFKGTFKDKNGKKRSVLLKRMDDDGTHTERVKDLLQERRFSKLHHINSPVILKIRGISMTRVPFFQVTENFPGVPLHEHMREHFDEMSNEDRCSIIFCISHALTYLHNKGIIHRDIAAANVLYDKNGVSKLTSLGLARMPQGKDGVYYMRKSRAMAVRWMAPENITSLIFTKASDTYSFGVFVYEVFTGHEPYLNRTMAEAKKAITAGEIPIFPISCPRKLVRMIEKHCLAKNPKDRAEMEDIAANLQEYSGLQLDVITKNTDDDMSDVKEVVGSDDGGAGKSKVSKAGEMPQ